MGLFINSQANNYTIVIGCGRLGANLAGAISNSGGNVSIIDKNEESFRKLSPAFGGITIVGDGTELSVLLEANIKKADAVVAVTNNDNINILVAQLAKEMYCVSHVIARLYDSERECVYNEFGIDTICPAVLSAKEIDKILNIPYTSEDEE